MRLLPTRLPALLLTAAALLCAPLAASASAPADDAPVPGVDYVEIEGGAPYRATPGTIEVAEVFAYWCGHCANFAPRLEAWKAKLPADVRVFRALDLPALERPAKATSKPPSGGSWRWLCAASR